MTKEMTRLKKKFKKKSHKSLLRFDYSSHPVTIKKQIEMQKTELIMKQCKLAPLLNSNSQSDMFETYGQPTVKYKSITSLTIITIIYTIRAG